MANPPQFSVETSPDSDDDRSSSLSDLDDGINPDSISGAVRRKMAVTDEDSEAETERLEISPNKAVKEGQVSDDYGSSDQNLPANPDLISAIHQLETERFSDSGISSPVSSDEEPLSDPASDHLPRYHNRASDGPGTVQASAGRKRKRASQENESDIDGEQARQSRRQRTGSIRSETHGNSRTSDDEASSSGLSRTGGEDPMELNENPDDDVMEANDDNVLPRIDQGGNGIAESRIGKGALSKARISLDEDPDERILRQEEEDDQVDGGDESDEEEIVEADEAEDVEAVARSEEEHVKRTAAMEALLDLEKRFATLRDRLYDERIAALNNELAQLSGPNPSHPEFLRQVQCVQQYRDEKFDIEQKLLVLKTGALKRMSIATRSQIHSAYFQTIRDVRERHLEKVSEHFYRIQRDRFKTDESIPNYSVPFQTRRSVQIIQQTAYNKEVSVLSGVAKYVGFPAAPDIASARAAELDEDMEKMGISSNPLGAPRSVQPPNLRAGFSAALSRPAAEEDFLEQTPWANPQHPVHQYLGHVNRTASVQSRKPQVPTSTPAGSKAQLDSNAGIGSASTILEKSSAPASSVLNTPHGVEIGRPTVGSRATETTSNVPLNGIRDMGQEKRTESASPSEARKSYLNSNPNNAKPSNEVREASPPAAHVALFSSPSRPSMPRADYEPRRQTASPLFNQHVRENGLAARPGLGGIGAR